ncbi:hypothetical protein GGR27_002096 [Lewinella antarctica]|uniref:Uncharacterized protein n=1 Tax=Neolewinella antarctica TaxID=442734 RepID=A0ABX0XC93_9BACT|nr:hypothetical protein [Neolewinella antarctica]
MKQSRDQSYNNLESFVIDSVQASTMASNESRRGVSRSEGAQPLVFVFTLFKESSQLR